MNMFIAVHVLYRSVIVELEQNNENIMSYHAAVVCKVRCNMQSEKLSDRDVQSIHSGMVTNA